MGCNGSGSNLPYSVECVLINFAVLHDEMDGFNALAPRLGVEIFRIATNHRDIFQRITIDDQNVSERARFDDAELAGIRIVLACQCHQLAAD